VKDDETYCAVIQNLIQTNCSRKVETINAGVFGYSSFQGVHQLQRRIVDLKPDFITICYNWNDHGGAIRMAEQGGNYAWHKGLPQRDRDLPGPASFRGTQKALSNLRLFQLMTYGMIHLQKVPETEEEVQSARTDLVRVPLDDYRDNLTKMIEIARKHNITPVLLTQALNPKSPFPLEKHDAYNKIVVELASQMNVPYVDAREILKEDTKLFSSNTHPTRRGHRLIATTLADTIRPLACP
jgi:lysophospholipase L1-like esterase